MKSLTSRQLEIAKLLHAGLTRAEIARTLAISENTVARHIFDATMRLGESGRPLAVLVRYYQKFHAAA